MGLAGRVPESKRSEHVRRTAGFTENIIMPPAKKAAIPGKKAAPAKAAATVTMQPSRSLIRPILRAV